MHEHGGLGDPLRIDVGSEVCWVGGWGEAREMADQPGGERSLGNRVQGQGKGLRMGDVSSTGVICKIHLDGR